MRLTITVQTDETAPYAREPLHGRRVTCRIVDEETHLIRGEVTGALTRETSEAIMSMVHEAVSPLRSMVTRFK